MSTRIQTKYSDPGEKVFVIGVNLDEKVDVAKRYISKNGAKWPQLWSAGGRSGSLALQLGIASVPTTILIRTDGTVAENQIIAPDLDREISRVIRRQKRAKAQAAKVRNNSR